MELRAGSFAGRQSKLDLIRIITILITTPIKPIDLSENPPAYEVANAFVEEASTSSDKQNELPKIDAKRKEILQESCKNSIMTASTDSKKLLKATGKLEI